MHTRKKSKRMENEAETKKGMRGKERRQLKKWREVERRGGEEGGGRRGGRGREEETERKKRTYDGRSRGRVMNNVLCLFVFLFLNLCVATACLFAAFVVVCVFFAVVFVVVADVVVRNSLSDSVIACVCGLTAVVVIVVVVIVVVAQTVIVQDMIWQLSRVSWCGR